MQQSVDSAWRPILDTLLKHPAGQSLARVAEQSKRDKSVIHRHLQAMVDAGLVRKEGSRKQARYSPVEHVDIAWTARFGDEWRRIEWHAEPPMDWRFPLAQRVNDDMGRRTLLRFLDVAWLDGLFTPWLFKVPLTKRIAPPSGFDEEKMGSYTQFTQNHENYEGITIAAFGSCVRGDARPESDVDVALIGPSGTGNSRFVDHQGKEFKAIAEEVNLGASRPLDLHVLRRGQTHKWPSPIRFALGKEGVTVFSTVIGGEWVEAMEGLPRE